MKLCIDCKYFNRFVLISSECKHPKNIKGIKPSTGDPEYYWYSANVSREDGFIFSLINHSCGKRARWFEPKEK